MPSAPTTQKVSGHSSPREYQAKDYGRLVGARGFSEDLLRTHFALYEGYVKHVNKCLELLRTPGLDAYAAAEVRRRLAWEFNGMRLHELYFDGMVAGGRELGDGPLQAALDAEHGSADAWWERFKLVGAPRGSGWAVLCYDPVADRLLQNWVNEHDRGVLAETVPLLALDLFEHAYMRDYGTDRAAYMAAFRAAVDWGVVESRFRAARRPSRPPAS